MGGIYIDTGIVMLDPLENLIKPNDKFIIPLDGRGPGLYNAFMATVPNHPILKKAIEMVVRNVKNRDYELDVLALTGPKLLSAAFEHITGEKPKVGQIRNDGINIILHDIDILRYGNPIVYKNDDGKEVVVAHTKYPSYKKEVSWYNTKPHYSKLWKERKVFVSKINE